MQSMTRPAAHYGYAEPIHPKAMLARKSPSGKPGAVHCRLADDAVDLQQRAAAPMAGPEYANGTRRFAALALQRLLKAGLLGCALATTAAFADSPVRKVIDGDSLVVRSRGREVEVRLAFIDAPEFRQVHGKQARAMLRSLVGGRRVRVEPIDVDVHRRVVARVFVGNHDVNAEMVRRGFAWVRRGFPHPRGLVRLEDRARAARAGLWANADPVPPWIWRKAHGRKRGSRNADDGAKPAAPSSATQAVRCGAKRYCRQMTSCREAFAYLRQCGVRSLDGDGDGVPCEWRLCR